MAWFWKLPVGACRQVKTAGRTASAPTVHRISVFVFPKARHQSPKSLRPVFVEAFLIHIHVVISDRRLCLVDGVDLSVPHQLDLAPHLEQQKAVLLRQRLPASSSFVMLRISLSVSFMIHLASAQILCSSSDAHAAPLLLLLYLSAC